MDHSAKGKSQRNLLTCFLLLTACHGTISEMEQPVPPGQEPPICVGDDCAAAVEEPVVETRIPRLTHSQWNATVTTLFNLETPSDAANDFDRDQVVDGFSTEYGHLVLTEGLRQDYQRAAEQIAEFVSSDGPRQRWLPDSGAGEGVLPTDAASRDSFLRAFGLRAYRRPLSDTELTQLGTLYDAGRTHFSNLDPNHAGVRIVLEGMLQSPHFLYRVDLSDEVDGEFFRIGSYAMATRLAYALTGTMPDEALFEAATAGELETEAQIVAQVDRLFAEEKAAPLFAAFHGEHFTIDTWIDTVRDQENFPNWRPGVAEAMVRETRHLLQETIRSGGDFRDFLLDRTAFVNEDLARLYGVEGVEGSEMREVELPGNRLGLLTRIGFLAKYSGQNQPDPIHRGLFVNVNLLCRDIPDAPPLDPEDLESSGTTNREQIESITHQNGCATCHLNMINPPGFALESFGATGEFREQDNGQPVNTVTEFGFANGDRAMVSSGVELSETVAERRESHECYSRRLLAYMFGRAESGLDAPIVYRMAEASHSRGASIQELTRALVTSRGFSHRTTTELEVMTDE